jgi:hypothetical protein
MLCTTALTEGQLQLLLCVRLQVLLLTCPVSWASLLHSPSL